MLDFGLSDIIVLLKGGRLSPSNPDRDDMNDARRGLSLVLLKPLLPRIAVLNIDIGSSFVDIVRNFTESAELDPSPKPECIKIKFVLCLIMKIHLILINLT